MGTPELTAITAAASVSRKQKTEKPQTTTTRGQQSGRLRTRKGTKAASTCMGWRATSSHLEGIRGAAPGNTSPAAKI
ncbi:MAG: hypothetical protein HFI80_12095 [Lachnospiraceae bacterium]|nr:hypothetical protein [Lachnospiraceae bacterium]